MISGNKRRITMKASRVFVFCLLGTCSIASAADGAAGSAESFSSPEQAVHSLASASHNNDLGALLKIFGLAGRDLVSSGDKVADKEARTRFYTLYREGDKISRDSEGKATLIIGTEEWPFPIPILRVGKVWHFDAQSGAEEILNRRIGRDELSAIEVCRNYLQAQREYSEDVGSAQQPEYAQKFISSPRRHDGLYWHVGPGDKESPIGPEMAAARAEGYDIHRKNALPPYHGYYYKILTRQGAAAPGGARDYIASGHMTGGFALIAYPAKYGDSGVMTFVVSQDGIVYEKNLGPNTAKAAGVITNFNPDDSWKVTK
jgi:hypothetical protein